MILPNGAHEEHKCEGRGQLRRQQTSPPLALSTGLHRTTRPPHFADGLNKSALKPSEKSVGVFFQQFNRRWGNVVIIWNRKNG